MFFKYQNTLSQIVYNATFSLELMYKQPTLTFHIPEIPAFLNFTIGWPGLGIV